MEQPLFRPPWLCSFWKVEQKTLVREEEEELEDSVVNLCLAGNGNRRALASQRAPRAAPACSSGRYPAPPCAWSLRGVGITPWTEFEGWGGGGTDPQYVTTRRLGATGHEESSSPPSREGNPVFR